MAFPPFLVSLLHLKKSEPTDWLYFLLGLFTYFYLVLITFFYFVRLAPFFPQTFHVLDAIAEPYLGAVAAYTILKELRKRKGVRRHYHGGWFVAAWMLLFVSGVSLAFFSSAYAYDDTLHVIITNSLGVLVIWVGSFIHKP